MRKKWLIVVLILLSVTLATAITITGEAITGKVITGDTVLTGDATQTVGMNISVQGPPILALISPKNQTYISNESILLNYTVDASADTMWYNINNTDNTTITSLTYFDVSEGSYKLYLFANNSNGNTAKNVSFFVNTTKFLIIDDEFDKEDDADSGRSYNKRENKKGNTTDFLNYTYEEIQNLSDVILHNPEYGMIQFNQPINLTDDENVNDNQIDLDTHTNFSFNRVEINSSALSNFNKSATLWLYNLTWEEPQIQRDGEDCPSTVCTEESYSDGTLKFNVTGFSIYTTIEGASESVYETPGGGTSGGGGSITKAKDFKVEPNKLQIKLRQGGTKKQELIIENTAKKKITINFQSNLGGFIRLEQSSFTLKKGEKKTIAIDFLAREDTVPDLYVGNLIIKSGEEQEKILISIEVESMKPLFDVRLDISKKFMIVGAGEDLPLETYVFNFGRIGEVDVNLDFIIKNEYGKTIAFGKETIAVATQASQIHHILIPKDAEEGEYIAYVKVSYGETVASASHWFFVGEKPAPELNTTILYLVIGAGIILLLILVEIILLRKQMCGKRKIGEKRIFNFGLIKRK